MRRVFFAGRGGDPAVEREERASELRRMLRDLPAAPEAAEEIARRRRED